MRKRIIKSSAAIPVDEYPALDIAKLAVAELSSEDPEYPIEGAIDLLGGDGWRAAEDGSQTIRLLFDPPVSVQRVHLEFRETVVGRQQEFVLSSRSAGDAHMREIVRQQFNFTPPDTITEVEEYRVEQSELVELRLHIVPDTSNRPVRATLARLRLS